MIVSQPGQDHKAKPPEQTNTTVAGIREIKQHATPIPARLYLRQLLRTEHVPNTIPAAAVKNVMRGAKQTRIRETIPRTMDAIFTAVHAVFSF